MSIEEKTHEVIDHWHERVKNTQDAHYAAGNLYERRFLQLGIPVIAMSALVGGMEVIIPSSVLHSFDLAKSVSGVVSLLIAVLAGLQTFLKLSQRSERHRMAAARYGEIKRSLEKVEIVCEESMTKASKELDKIKSRMDSLAIESPELPTSILKNYINPEENPGKSNN